MRRGNDDRRLAGFLVALGARHADFGANVAGQRDEEGVVIVFGAGDVGAGALEVLLQLEGIALDGEIEVADGESADDVADGPAGQIDVHAGGAGDVLNQGDALLLVGRQPEFHRVDVVSHSLSSGCQALGQRVSTARIAPGEGSICRAFHRISTGRDMLEIRP